MSNEKAYSMTEQESIFEKMMAGRIPARMAHQDDHCIAIHDINPQAPVHLLIIPRKRIYRIGRAVENDREVLGHLLLVARDLAREMELENGFRIVINNGPDGGETVPHLHVHLLGGRALTWPPG